jgi:hypothetical protein
VVKAFSPGRSGNRLLNLLPSNEYESVQHLLRKVDLRQNQVLYEVRGQIDEILFPVTCVLSAVTVMLDGHAIEVATVGNEGVSGLPAFALVTNSPHRVFTQIGGGGLEGRCDGDQQRTEQASEISGNHQQHLPAGIHVSGVAVRGVQWLAFHCRAVQSLALDDA